MMRHAKDMTKGKKSVAPKAKASASTKKSVAAKKSAAALPPPVDMKVVLAASKIRGVVAPEPDSDIPVPNRRNNGTFGPGNLGNPTGRPKMSKLHRLAFCECSELGIAALKAILNGSDETAKASDRVRAAEVAFDRTWGKPLQQVEARVDSDRSVIDTSGLSGTQIEVLAALAIGVLDAPGSDDDGESSD